MGDEKIDAVEENQETGAWTVTVPAGTEDVVINVTTVGQKYDLSIDAEYWDVNVEGMVDGKVTVGETYKVTATATVADDDHNTTRNFMLDGILAGEGTLTTAGEDPGKDSTSVDSKEDVKFAQEQKAVVDHKLYSSVDMTNEFTADDVTDNTSYTVYYYTDEGMKAVFTGEITIGYDADGQLTLTVRAA